MPKISVVLPVYNGASFIGAAIDSVLVQTLPDWELLIVDDGSTDSTPEILARYDDPRIHVTRQSNGGEGAARNTALEQAHGQYIAFLDADDLYLPKAFYLLTEFLEQYPQYGLVFADGDVIDKQGRRLMTLTEHRPAICTGDVLEAIVLDPAVLTVPVCTLVRSQVIRQAQARFDTTLRIGTDWDFWIQLARVCQFGYLDQRTCAYRIHETNITALVPHVERRRNLIAARKNVLAQSWFADLQLITRYRFLYHLVFHLADVLPDEQQTLLGIDAVRALPPAMQASLWRVVGMQWLANGLAAKGRAGLETAARIAPGDRKTRLLLALSKMGAAPALLVFGAWQSIGRLRHPLRQPQSKRSRPMPHNLPANVQRSGKEPE